MNLFKENKILQQYTCNLYIIHHYICTKEKNIYLIFNPIYPKSPVNV